MKITNKLTILALALLVLTASANAQSPPEELLKQMVGQLQQTPNDNALRVKIIKLGAEIKPAPAIPEEANRAFVKAGVFSEGATPDTGYAPAISAYGEALRQAPWWGDAYFNLSVTLEKAKKYDGAIAELKHYQLSVPAESAEARNAQNKIYAMEAKAELAATKKTEEDKAVATKQAEEQQAASAKKQEAAKAAAAAEDRKKNSIEGYWFWTGNDYFEASTTPNIQIVRVGQSLAVKPVFMFGGSTITEVQTTETSLRITYMPVGTVNCHMLCIYELSDGDLVGTTTNLEMREKGSKNATTTNRYIRKLWTAK